MRRVAEAIAAFEIIIRLSPPTSAWMLPRLVAWFDAALCYALNERRSSGQVKTWLKQEVQKIDDIQLVVKHTGRVDVAVLVAQRIKRGFLSELVSCTLGGCVAAGPLCKPEEHLQQLRLLALLLRGPQVLRASSRLLAACAVPLATAEDDALETVGFSTRGTVPRHAVEGENGEGVTEAEAEVQKRVYAQTVKSLRIALQFLKNALFPGAQDAAVLKELTAAKCTPQCNFQSDRTVEETFLAAVSPPQLRWLPGSSVRSAARNTPGIDPAAFSNEQPEEAECCWTFDTDSVPSEDTPRKLALYVLGSVKASDVHEQTLCMYVLTLSLYQRGEAEVKKI